ncbi:MAG: enoyl-CoA hydratase/isomerase family protein [Streptosporangiales bacterium]|nr:enoyl-CoA hydratase/isomerase family protein [Streptosporangiales bacterium]
MAELDVTRTGAVVTVTLNRAAKRNALSADLVEELIDAVQATPDDTQLLVLRGSGKNLSAGFDFGEGGDPDTELLHRFVRIELLLQAIHHAPYATVALAHGRNFGAGADLFVACDHRVASPDATFRFPGLAFGLVLGTRRLAHRTSPSWAQSTLAGLRTVDAAEASAAGLATAVVEPGEWDAHVTRLQHDTDTLTPKTRARLHDVLTPDTRDADLADLVRSAASPGLAHRIRRFREGAHR